MNTKGAEEYYNEGRELQGNEEYEGAMDKYYKSLKIDENFVPSLLNYGDLTAGFEKDHFKSIPYFLKIISIEAEHMDAYELLMHRFYHIVNEYENLKKIFGLKKEENLYWQAWEVGCIFKRKDEAILMLKEAYKINNNSLLSLMRIADLYKEMGNISRAISYYKEIIRKFIISLPKSYYSFCLLEKSESSYLFGSEDIAGTISSWKF